MDDSELRKMEFLNTLALNSYNQIIENSRQLDQKVHNIIALASTIMPVLLGLFYYLSTQGLSQVVLPYVVFAVGFGVLAFVVAIAKGSWTYKTTKYKALDSQKFAQTHISENYPDVVEVAVSTLADMADQNWHLVDRKASSYETTLLFLTIGAVAFGVGFFLLLFALIYPYFLPLV